MGLSAGRAQEAVDKPQPASLLQSKTAPGVKQGAAEMGQASSGVSNSMIGQRRPAVAVHPELAEKDNVAEAIDQVLDEVRAARRDLRVTGFCLQQAEAVRRIDRAKASIADLAQSRNRKSKHSPHATVERTTNPRVAPVLRGAFRSLRQLVVIVGSAWKRLATQKRPQNEA